MRGDLPADVRPLIADPIRGLVTSSGHVSRLAPSTSRAIHPSTDHSARPHDLPIPSNQENQRQAAPQILAQAALTVHRRRGKNNNASASAGMLRPAASPGIWLYRR